jgi:hypothetical protein
MVKNQRNLFGIALLLLMSIGCFGQDIEKTDLTEEGKLVLTKRGQMLSIEGYISRVSLVYGVEMPLNTSEMEEFIGK